MRRSLGDMLRFVDGLPEHCVKFILALPHMDRVKACVTQEMATCPEATDVPVGLMRAMTGAVTHTHTRAR